MSRLPAEGVHYDQDRREHVVVLVLLPHEAEEVAQGFGPGDGAYDEIMKWAEEARELDEE